MIYLYTDFGYSGPYVGLMKSVLSSQYPDSPVIDLMHDAPRFDPMASAYLLASIISYLPEQALVLGVVDPGVGDEQRRPIIVKADQRWFIGPDNGLFNVIVKRAEHVSMWEITWRPETMSKSFHGRDLFAPVTAMIAKGDMPESELIDINSHTFSDWDNDLAKIIYIDHYGNCMTGIRAETVSVDSHIMINGQSLSRSRTFSDVEQGEAFWYENSLGLIEVAVNQGSASDALKIKLGEHVSITN
ncbi:MAG: SAM-dependent chlorinase/fluorinase [Gammaproteobacteria bacterium]|nr:SAM-dependent chlorinase/fluorinase [Gammaproteobacteria bacterium]